MPTYAYQCPDCGRREDVFQSIRDYCHDRKVPVCEEHPEIEMQRRLSVNPTMSGLANALAGDRHYDGMRAPDGTDIGSRSKHREYMKRHGLTTVDDFSGTWKSQQEQRERMRAGTHSDKELRSTVEQAFYQKMNGGQDGA